MGTVGSAVGADVPGLAGKARVARGWGIAAPVAALLIALTGCAAPAFPPSGAQDPDTVAAREAAVSDERALLERAAMQPPLAEASNDFCDAGQDNWKIHDSYYWMCSHSTEWAVPDEQSDPAVLISTYRAHLASVGCEPDVASFDMVESYWATLGVAGQNVHGDPYTIDSLPDAVATCRDYSRVSIRFNTPAGALSNAEYTATGDEVVSQSPLDLDAIRTTAAPHVVTLRAGTTYHYISRYAEDEEQDSEPEDPPACFCHSGGTCECPGG